MSSFSLHEFVRAVYDETAEVDPGRLTHAVLTALASVPQTDRDAAFEQALHLIAQRVLNNVRRSPHHFPGGHIEAGTQDSAAAGDPVPDSANSWKTQASREYWRKQLEDPYPFWDGKKTWVAFGDLTVDALDRSAVWHDTLAAANGRKATEMREWAQLLREHKVDTVRELPEEVLRARLSRGAAA